MNIKKTSLIALIALLTCDVHASTASVTRAGTKRIGTTGNRATVGGKAVSLSGGSSLNKLQSNRVQSGYSPIAPTDKSNEILEAMYDEMQKVQDTFTARIEQLEKTIEDKEAEIDELKEELENTQESVQEIADGGFITEEMVAAQIDDAKATIKAERDADIDKIKNEIQANVDKLDNNIKNINIDGAIEDKLARKGYATTAQLAEDIDAAKAEITNARNAALKSYATSADVSSAVTAAKTEAIAAANTAIEAESATRSAIVEKLATKEELENLEVGVDEERLKGIIDTELKSKDYATTTQLAEDIDAAKNEAIAQAKTEAVAEVNGMGFAKTATIESDILTAKNAAIEQATTAALAEVERKGFATNASVQNLKAEITTERNAALKSYATSADVSSAVTAAKTDAITTANNAITTAIAAESAARSAIVEKLATKEELQDLELGVDEATVVGIVDEVLDTKKVISEDTPAFQEVQQQVAAMPTTYAKSSALTDLESMVEKNTQGIAEADTAIKAEAATRTEIVATLATKKDLQNLELGVDETTVAGIVDEVLDTKKVISEDTPVFQEVASLRNKDTLTTLLGDTYATSSALTSLGTRVTKNAQDITATQESVNNISDTIADTLLSDEDFKGGVLAGLSTELTELPARVTELDNAVKGLGNTYATQADVNDLRKPATLAGLLGDIYVKPATLDNRITGLSATYATKDELGNYAIATDLADLKKPATLAGLLGDIYVKPATLDNRITGLSATYATKDELGNYAIATDLADLKKPATLAGLLGDIYVKPATLDNRITGLSATYATKEALNTVDGKFANYLKGTDFDSRLSSSTVLDGKFVKPADFGGLLKDADLSTNGKFSALSTTVSSLGNTYATKDELGNYATATDLANLKKPATLAGLLGDIYVKPATLDNRITGLSATYATKEALNTVDGKFANYVKGADFGGLLKDADLSTNSKFSALSTTVSGLGNTYATKSELGNYATATDLANLKKPATLTTLLGDTYVKPATLDNRITGLSATYATKGDVNTLQNSVNSMPSIIVESISTPGDKMYIGNWTNKKDGKLLVVTSDNVSYHVDDKEQPIFMTQDTLGTSIDILLDNKEGKTRLHEIASGVDSLNTNVGKINSNVTSLGTSVGNLSSSFTTLSGKAVTTDNFADKLTANNVVTTGNLGTKLQGNSVFTNLSSTAVTKSSLTADLYSKLSHGTCSETGASLDSSTDNLKSLLNGTFTTCSTGKDGLL